jgi:hypothetical protein
MTQELEAGEGVGVIDPHGDLLDHIPPCRTDHVVYFNPADQDYPVTWLLRRPPNWWASLKKVLDWSPRQDRLTGIEADEGAGAPSQRNSKSLDRIHHHGINPSNTCPVQP